MVLCCDYSTFGLSLNFSKFALQKKLSLSEQWLTEKQTFARYMFPSGNANHYSPDRPEMRRGLQHETLFLESFCSTWISILSFRRLECLTISTVLLGDTSGKDSGWTSVAVLALLLSVHLTVLRRRKKHPDFWPTSPVLQCHSPLIWGFYRQPIRAIKDQYFY